MKYSFDKEIDRISSNSIKWNYIQNKNDFNVLQKTNAYYGENRILPMWVADMDFTCPQPVIDALATRAVHGIFGYTGTSDSYLNSVVNWMAKRHAWNIKPEWICTSPGVVPAINMLIRTFAKPDDKVIIQTPVYYPFFSAIKNNKRQIVENPLIKDHDKYRIDFDDLDLKTKDPSSKLLILCSPHNPVGRVWTNDELKKIGEICLKNKVLVISDEIHSDLVFKEYKFTPFATINETFKENCIVCTAASKTFNLAGLHTSNIIIPNENLRTKFMETIYSNGLAGMNTFGLLATETAYNEGEDWLEQVLSYIQDNFTYLKNYIKENIPEIKVTETEATYLIWLDFRGLKLSERELRDFSVNKAGIFFDEGFIFGEPGIGFERINIACPRSILEEGLIKLKNAAKSLR
ncbi:MAG TPA: MalY/PatB family protein [Victivallales bacterium]|nr:MalY/PatB family protein [Victivallales bacterium]